jgi:hypothetical protein
VRGRKVDCQASDSIQDRMDKAVASADQGEAVIINLATDCRQDVVITGNGQLLCNSDAFAYGVASYFCNEQFATRSP